MILVIFSKPLKKNLVFYRTVSFFSGFLPNSSRWFLITSLFYRTVDNFPSLVSLISLVFPQSSSSHFLLVCLVFSSCIIIMDDEEEFFQSEFQCLGSPSLKRNSKKKEKKETSKKRSNSSSSSSTSKISFDSIVLLVVRLAYPLSLLNLSRIIVLDLSD